MAHQKAAVRVTAGARDRAAPVIRDLSFEDLREALSRGLDDFKAMPSHVFLLAIIYPIMGAVLVDLTFGYRTLPLIFPLMAGFALVGPLAAVGLYEMSRLREQGKEPTWRDAFRILKAPALPAIAAVGLLQLLIYLVWLAAAMAIYNMTMGGMDITTPGELLRYSLTTSPGWALIVIGTGVGFLFAVAVLLISVVSFPMLLDRNVSAATAIETSIRACLANPRTMAGWGLIVTALLIIGMLPLFVGLAIIMPVLGHATWHLYRRVVVH